jgi:2',3'-cyclic-nucleotide 2'-phosphodiesterase/3'-nucleotidase
MIVAALVLPSWIHASSASAQSETTTITILQTSDLHTNLMPWDYYTGQVADWGLARVATLVKQERAKDPNLLLLDSGDTIQGTPLGYYYARIDENAQHPMAVTMNALKYDAAAIGNHEFNYGLTTLNRWKNQLTFPLLSANTRTTDGAEAFQPYVIKEVNGVKIGILGLTTPAIPNWEKPENIAGLKWDNPVETAKQYVPRMKAEGADIIVISQHIGWDKTPSDTRDPQAWLTDPSTWQPSGSLPDENLTIQIAQQVPGVDVILAGHSHVDVPKSIINGVLIVEPSYWGRALAKVTLQLQRNGGSWQLVSKDSGLQYVRGVDADKEISDLAYPYHDQTIKYISTPIGTATGEFAGGPQARYTDSPLSDLINTVQADAAATAGYPVDISLAAIFNDTGHIPQGQVSLRDAYSAYIYDNTLYVLEINGDILRRALEKDAEYFKIVDPQNLPADPKGVVSEQARDYNWDIYTGIDYTIDVTKPVGQRVTKLQFKGQDVRPDQTFRIAINNYRASGGGGYGMFREGKRIWASTSEIRDLMAAYVQARPALDPQAINTKNFTIVPDLYTHYFGAGRTTPSQPARSDPVASGGPANRPAGSAPAGSPAAQQPASLPNTGSEYNVPLLLIILAGVALAAGAALRRRARA